MALHVYTAGLLGSRQLGSSVAGDDDELTAIQHTRYGGVFVTVLTLRRTDREPTTVRLLSADDVELRERGPD